MECLERKAFKPVRIMKSNRIYTKLAFFAVLLLVSVTFFAACINKRADFDKLLNDVGLPNNAPLSDFELSEDIIISIEHPDSMSGADEDHRVEGSDSATDEDHLPSDEMEGDRENSSTTDDVVLTPDDTPSQDTGDEPDDAVQIGRLEEIYTMYDVPLLPAEKEYVVQTAERFGIPPELVFGVMYVESRYTASAISKNGKYIGIMQIAKSNLSMLNRKFGITDLRDFQQNVTSGAYLLSYFYRKYDGDVDRVLMCYHCGEGGAKKSWRNGYFSDGYCRKVKKEIDRILLSMEPAQISGKISQ